MVGGESMSAKRKAKARTKAPPGIVPVGDGPGLYRVRHADGTLSEVVTLTEAQDMLKASREDRK
jgi:hypothetical protein